MKENLAHFLAIVIGISIAFILAMLFKFGLIILFELFSPLFWLIMSLFMSFITYHTISELIYGYKNSEVKPNIFMLIASCFFPLGFLAISIVGWGMFIFDIVSLFKG